LNRLKELIDEKFVTSNSQLLERRVLFLDATGQQKRIVMRVKKVGGRKVDYVLSLQKVEDSGVFTDLKLPESQKKNPSQQTIGNLLLGGTVKADQYSYLDTKLNGYSLHYTRNFKEVEELELKAKYGKRTVACESKQDLGIICTCSKK
jgi:hypothetical protein